MKPPRNTSRGPGRPRLERQPKLAPRPRSPAAPARPNARPASHEADQIEYQHHALVNTHIQLEASRQRYADLYDFAPVGYLTVDRFGCIVELNLTAMQFLRQSNRRSVVGKPLLTFISRNQRRKFLQHLTLSRRSANRISSELELARDPGETRFCFEFVSVPIGENGPAASHLRCAMIDCTQRKISELELKSAKEELEHRIEERTRELTRANRVLRIDAARRTRTEQALRHSEEQIRLVIEGTRNYSMFLLDPEGRIVSWNSGAERLHGYTARQILGRHFSCFYTRSDQRKGKPGRMLEMARRDGRAEDESWRVRRNGSRYFASVVLSSLREPGGHVRGFVKITRNISGRVRAQEALRRTTEKLSDFFEGSPIGLLWVKPNGLVQRTNRAWRNLVGYSSDECRLRHVTKFDVSRKSAARLLRSLRQHQVLQNTRARLRRKDGTVRHVLIDADGLWSKGRMVHSRWFVRDITERVNLEREILMVSEREQTRIGRDLHDDLCQQLTGIEFSTQVLARRLAASAPQDANRLREIAQLVRDSLNSARNLSHSLAMAELETEGLTDALRAHVARVRNTFKVDARFGSNTQHLKFDYLTSVHLYRIAQEAIANSVKHGRARRIYVGLHSENNRLILAVNDNGAGFPRKPRKSKGIGLRVMQYRAGMIGATLTVHPGRKRGTTLVCVLNDPIPTTPEKA